MNDERGFLGPLLGGLGGLVGGGLQYASAKDAQKLQLKMHEDTLAFNREEAMKNRHFQEYQANIHANRAVAESQRNRDFQERMSSTAYQRSREDMIKAGYNPMLAFQQGGASSPAGSSGSFSSPSGSQASGPVGQVSTPDKGAAIKQAVNSAIESFRINKEMRHADSQIALNKAAEETQKAAAALNVNNARKAESEARIYDAKLPAIKEETKYKKRQYKYDIDYQKFDNINRRLRDGLGTVGDIFNSVTPRIKVLGPKGPKDPGSKERNFKKNYYKRQRIEKLWEDLP